MLLRFLLILLLSFSACSKSDIEDAIDIADGVPRKDIDRSKLAINAFVNDGRFGSISQQFNEVRNVLGISKVRILFNWDNNVQGSPNGSLNFNYYDDIVSSIPSGVSAIVVVTGTPSWMTNSANWIDGDPRATFLQKWLRPVLSRYGSNGKLEGFEIWNEPNMIANAENQVMGFAESPETYADFFKKASALVRNLAPGKLCINAATTAINQNFPSSVDYNRRMRDAGVADFTDVWNVHYYGRQYEKVITDGGVADFLNGLNKTVWITESGAQGVNNQLAYGEQAWPFLIDKIPSIQRIYIYQFTEATPPDVSYGLKNLSSDFPISDLYIHLSTNQ